MGSRRNGFNFLGRARAGIAAAVATGGVLLLALPGAANASLLGLGGSCPAPTLTQPFLQWGDANNYVLAPGGDFEGPLAGWSLSGGASRMDGSETYGVTGNVGSYSLSLPAGAVAVSPPLCVTSAYPDFRLFLKSAASSSSVRVEVVYQGLLGLVSGLLTPSSGLSGGTTWQPSPQLSTSSTIPTLLGTAMLQIRFTGLTGTSQLDDVYVDPHGRG